MATAHQISLSLYSTSRLFIQLIQSRLSESGLTYPQFLVLSVLWESDGQNVHQIGEKLHLDSGTLTPLLKKLETLNYVQRIRSKEDERVVHIELTYPGKSLQSSVENTLKELDASFENFPELKFEELNHSLFNLLEIVQTLKNN